MDQRDEVSSEKCFIESNERSKVLRDVVWDSKSVFLKVLITNHQIVPWIGDIGGVMGWKIKWSEHNKGEPGNDFFIESGVLTSWHVSDLISSKEGSSSLSKIKIKCSGLTLILCLLLINNYKDDAMRFYINSMLIL